MPKLLNWLKQKPAPDTPSFKTEKKPAPAIKNDLTRAEINEIRKSEFETLGIPYDLVLEAEKNGITKIDPPKIVADTVSNNSKLVMMGLPIKLSYLECFASQLLYFDYVRFREFQKRVKKLILPERSLIDIMILAEAEKIIRAKYKLDKNPEADDLAERFQAEVRETFEKFCNQSINHQLRQRAERQLRREKNLSESEPLTTIEIETQIEKIKAERAKLSAKTQ